ncbi:MAG: hypothetical protein ACRCXT_08590 [Paraclostridium sp.]
MNKFLMIILIIIISSICSILLLFSILSFIDKDYETAIGEILTAITGIAGTILGYTIRDKKSE